MSGPGADGVLGTADDVYLRPIQGVEVYILGMEGQAVYTDAQGRFSFPSVPTGDVKLALVGNVPGVTVYDPAQQQFVDPNSEGFYFPEMVMDLNIQPGVANTVMGTMGTTAEEAADATNLGVYLPRLQTAILQPVSNTQPTTITVPAQAAPDLTPQQRQFLTATVQPGSAIGMNGQVMNDVQLGISTVPTSLIKDMLPVGVQQPALTITVQAPGVATFTTPVSLTFPNVYGAAPGTKQLFMSFDHTTGRLDLEGTATVSADGLSVVTDPDSGLTHPGWHFVISGSPAEFTLGDVLRDEADPVGGGPDWVFSDGQIQQYDQQINDAVNSLGSLIKQIPGLGSLVPTFNLSPIESGLELLAHAAVSSAISIKGADSGLVNEYFNHFISGDLSGQRITANDLLGLVQQDSTVMTNLANYKSEIEDAINQEINAEAATGKVDLNQVRDVVMNSLDLDAHDDNVTFFSNGTLNLIIDQTQEAKVELNMLQASGTITDPSVGGTGTWSAQIVYTLSDDFGFDPNDVTGQINNFMSNLGKAGTAVSAAAATLSRQGRTWLTGIFLTLSRMGKTQPRSSATPLPPSKKRLSTSPWPVGCTSCVRCNCMGRPRLTVSTCR